ncbi:MAG: hypothetical protein IPK14_06655 [Blastocatellia bacterium]|nr:hypothetical protein [Blastocatellia bacterium]
MLKLPFNNLGVRKLPIVATIVGVEKLVPLLVDLAKKIVPVWLSVQER